MEVHAFLVTPVLNPGRNDCPVVDWIDEHVPSGSGVSCALYWPEMDTRGRPTKGVLMVSVRGLTDKQARACADALSEVHLLGRMDTDAALGMTGELKAALDAREVPAEKREAAKNGELLNNVAEWIRPGNKPFKVS